MQVQINIFWDCWWNNFFLLRFPTIWEKNIKRDQNLAFFQSKKDNMPAAKNWWSRITLLTFSKTNITSPGKRQFFLSTIAFLGNYIQCLRKFLSKNYEAQKTPSMCCFLPQVFLVAFWKAWWWVHFQTFFFCGIVHTLCKIREFKRLQIKGFVFCNNLELEWQRIVLEEQLNEIL